MLLNTAESIPQHVGVVLSVIVDNCGGLRTRHSPEAAESMDDVYAAAAVDMFWRMQDQFQFRFVVAEHDSGVAVDAVDGEASDGESCDNGGGDVGVATSFVSDTRPRISLSLFTDLLRLCVRHDRPGDARRLFAAVCSPSDFVVKAYARIAKEASSPCR